MSRDDKGSLIDVVLRPMTPRSAQTIINSIIYTILVFLLVIVMVPLLWMVVTAFKVKGTAFSLRFLPQTEFYSPAENLPPLDMPQSITGHLTFFEVAAPTATTVDLLLYDPGSDEPRVMAMTPSFAGAWIAPVEELAAGEYGFQFSINGGPPSPDPRDETAENGDTISSLTVSGEPSLIAGGAHSPLARVYMSRGAFVAEVKSEPGRRLFIDLPGQMPLRLSEESPGVYKAFEEWGPATPPDSYRILEKLPITKAISNLYTVDNFLFILNSPDFTFSHYFMNSLVVAGSCALLTVLICLLAGYAFAVFPFHYREGLFYLLLSSMLVPGMIYMVPQFSITLNLGLMNTYSGMVIPHLANVFGLFLLRQYIGQIPRDLFHAAEIDGARDYQVLSNVVIPICLPIMVTLFLLVFVMQWSNFLWQLIVNTGDSQVLTLPVGLQQFKGQNANEWERIMAGACFSILPITVLFLVLQRYFLEGLTAGAVKE